MLGQDRDGIIYVLADYTDVSDQRQWMRSVVDACADCSPSEVYWEAGSGFNLVPDSIRPEFQARGVVMPPFRPDSPRDSKALRADAIASLYRQGKVRHVRGGRALHMLEAEMSTWRPGDRKSPGRIDALGVGCRGLNLGVLGIGYNSPGRPGIH